MRRYISTWWTTNTLSTLLAGRLNGLRAILGAAATATKSSGRNYLTRPIGSTSKFDGTNGLSNDLRLRRHRGLPEPQRAANAEQRQDHQEHPQRNRNPALGSRRFVRRGIRDRDCRDRHALSLPLASGTVNPRHIPTIRRSIFPPSCDGEYNR